MRLSIALVAAAAALTAAGAAQAASVEIRDAVVRVTVVPSDRSDIRVEVVSPHAELPLQIRTDGDRTVIDGDLDRGIRNINGKGDNARVTVRGVGDVSWDEMPQVVIHTPRNVVVSSNGAVYGSIGRSANLELHNSGYARWTVADVDGEAEIHESGAGSVRMGAAGRLNVRLSGAASIEAVRVSRGLDADLSGAGGLKVQEVSGPMRASVSGVGHVRVAGGRAGAVRASVSGVGGVAFDGAAESLDASVSGLGSVRVRQVNGPVRKSVSGIGKVKVGD